MKEQADQSVAGDAFAFTGTWRDYLPIAASNFFLTIVTLSVYRSWAKARERRYLWSHTIFIDDRLEWTGTGKEMFIGFLFAMLVGALPLFLLNLLSQSLILHGHPGLAALSLFALYLFAFALFGFARFRALRYRLSRSWWHGIRGGSDSKGGAYAWSSLWKTLVGFFAATFLMPWALTSLWNERWNAMSFGPHRFDAAANTDGLMGRWALFVLGPVVLALVGAVLAMATGPAAFFITLPLAYLGYLAGGLAFYAAYFRKAIGTLELGEMQFQFDASSWDLAKLVLGDIALVIGTLGLGIMFLHYRHWSFLIRHLGATGLVDLENFTQSTTTAPKEAEGFADAFDVGAF
jgi:uncharacterized membrane protein YjgN (DUF898 family)